MLAEAFLHFTAETSPALRRLGLVGDAVALWSRATRRRSAWAAHEARCHDAVQTALAACPSRRTALVLGSGLVRDVPLAALVVAFDRVVLVDAVHLLPARRRMRDQKIERVVADLTGWAAYLTGEAAGRIDGLAALRARRDIDLVVSANVLSQLPMALESWIERRPASAAMLPSDLGSAVVRTHLADLASLGAPVCLLTDTRYRDVDATGRELDRQDLLHGVALPPPDASWDWEVAPPGEIDRRFARIHEAGAWTSLRL